MVTGHARSASAVGPGQALPCTINGTLFLMICQYHPKAVPIRRRLSMIPLPDVPLWASMAQ